MFNWKRRLFAAQKLLKSLDLYEKYLPQSGHCIVRCSLRLLVARIFSRETSEVLILQLEAKWLEINRILPSGAKLNIYLLDYVYVFVLH